MGEDLSKQLTVDNEKKSSMIKWVLIKNPVVAGFLFYSRINLN